jgi:GNAT superfamily N-acetyltransferase
VSGVIVAAVDPASATDADVAATHAVHIAAMTVDRPDDPQPPLADFALRLNEQRDDQRRYWFVARSGDVVVGYARLWLPQLHNLHAGEADVVVRPESRRQGTGTALLRAAVTALSAEHRRLLVSNTREAAGEGFCRMLGPQRVQTGRISVLRIADVDWGDVRAAAAAEHPGYRIRAYTGGCPDDLIDSYVRAKSAMNDAPFDDADLTDFVFTADGMRADEKAAAEQGEWRVVLAVQEDSGEVAAFTEVLVTRQPWSSQRDTAVVPEHRGHGLGLWVKADMLVRLQEQRPDVSALATGNSATNAHMLRINDRLGFRPWSEVHGWQGDVDELVSRL